MGPLQKFATLTPWFNTKSVHDYSLRLSQIYEETLESNSVLDIGCGPGKLSVEFTEKYKAKRYIGIDYSLGMVQDAKHDNPQADFICANVVHLPFPDKSFDVVHSTRLFHHLAPEVRAGAILEQLRIARKALIIEDLFGFEKSFWHWPHRWYYTLADGSYYRYTLAEWKHLFNSLNVNIEQVFYSSEKTILGRCVYWVLSPQSGTNAKIRD